MDDQELSNVASLDELEKSLSNMIKYMLDKDFNRLLHAFYKIDLDEQRFKEILSQAPPESLAHELAKEVINRELQKVATRLKYKL